MRCVYRLKFVCAEVLTIIFGSTIGFEWNPHILHLVLTTFVYSVNRQNVKISRLFFEQFCKHELLALRQKFVRIAVSLRR